MDVCPVCQEEFVKYWAEDADDGEGAWMLRNVEEIPATAGTKWAGRILHCDCAKVAFATASTALATAENSGTGAGLDSNSAGVPASPVAQSVPEVPAAVLATPGGAPPELLTDTPLGDAGSEDHAGVPTSSANSATPRLITATPRLEHANSGGTAVGDSVTEPDNMLQDEASVGESSGTAEASAGDEKVGQASGDTEESAGPRRTKRARRY
eukprot:SAG31_NODE_3593_length_4090_cov_3.403909_1_plen_211_part_00